MTRAEIETVYPDEIRAREFIEQARVFFADAENPIVSGAGSFFLYYQACLAGMDALLAAAGSRVTSGEESHRVRIADAARLAGPAHSNLFERLDVWRADRNQVSYAAVDPPGASVGALRADTRDLLTAIAALLGAKRR